MVKIPAWVWIAIPVIGLLGIGIRGMIQTSYFRGIADDAAARLEVQELVLDSVTAHADSLSEALMVADSAAAAQRLVAEREVAILTRRGREARRRLGAASDALRASLDSVQEVELDIVVESYEVQIVALERVVEIERGLVAVERRRVTQGNVLLLGLRSVLEEHETSAGIMTAEITALRSANRTSFGIRLKSSFWMAAVGLAVGVIIAK
jgi:hypothetical protein